ncbi:MAG: branched-chain amino acid ABC transporter permease [Rhodospirillaceae bacterium]|nr:branched-chain amino acid ABC transporter permease [Rhodospirillaceae bacterium]|tara:strand:- start:38276 stop:39217 length:942 start_codon:yes stop_codon:yes gene_type:complete
MSEVWLGYLLYLIALLTMGGIYSILTVGLNIQWGFTGLFNVGIAGFFAIGAYTSALITSPISEQHLGGYDLPVAFGFIFAMISSAVIGYFVGKLCIRLRSDYLAIATIGVAEIFRLILKNELWATNGPRGISNIPRPFEDLAQPWSQLLFLTIVLIILFLVYIISQKAHNSPWGRVMRAIRDNDKAAEAIGKNVEKFRIQAFMFGCSLMGLGGALTAHYFKFIGPEATEPVMATFLIWVMLIIGGSGNNLGAIIGAFLVWTIWSGMEIFTAQLPPDWAVKATFLRIFLVGLVLQVILQKFPLGIFQEKPPKRD